MLHSTYSDVKNYESLLVCRKIKDFPWVVTATAHILLFAWQMEKTITFNPPGFVYLFKTTLWRVSVSYYKHSILYFRWINRHTSFDRPCKHNSILIYALFRRVHPFGANPVGGVVCKRYNITHRAAPQFREGFFSALAAQLPKRI